MMGQCLKIGYICLLSKILTTSPLIKEVLLINPGLLRQPCQYGPYVQVQISVPDDVESLQKV
jgi:hypothetical protein